MKVTSLETYFLSAPLPQAVRTSTHRITSVSEVIVRLSTDAGLMGIGEANQFADAFEECRLPQERAKVALQLKHLVTPAGMGENFHVLLAAKGIDAKNLAGLSGLSFANSRQRGA